MQKGQTHTLGYAVGMQYAVGTLSAKRSTHTVGYTVGMQYAVGTQYAVRYAVCSRS